MDMGLSEMKGLLSGKVKQILELDFTKHRRKLKGADHSRPQSVLKVRLNSWRSQSWNITVLAIRISSLVYCLYYWNDLLQEMGSQEVMLGVQLRRLALTRQPHVMRPSM